MSAPPFDRRRTPINDRVAAAHLAAQAEGRTVTAGRLGQVTVPVTDLRRAPDGPRDRQLLLGATVQIFDQHAGWCFVQAAQDGYVGYVAATDVSGTSAEATHWVSAPASHAYTEADFKSPERMALSFGSQIRVEAQGARFAETPWGYVPRAHLRPLDARASDPVAVAEMFLGTPYLWGGNSRWGIDCSGLIQAACLACGIECPGDSDQQEAELGAPCEPGASYQRGDLLFWKGHVGIMADAARLLHANVFHMAVAFENIHAAITRIAAQGDGPVTAHKRLSTG